MPNLKVHNGDQVMVISGKEAGKTGKVLHVDTEKRRVVVERLNMVKKATRPHPKKNPQGGIIEREGPLNVSNVMVVCPACGQTTRVGYRLTGDGGKVRHCRRANCNADIDKG